MDVTAFYSNFPVKEGIHTVLNLLEEHEEDIDMLGLERRDIQYLLDFVLNNSYCSLERISINKNGCDDG